MALSVADFWRLAERSQLLTNQQCQQFNGEYRSTHRPPEVNDAVRMAAWLVSRNVFSQYQTAVLLAGHPGPFVYGDYRIYDRLETGRLAGWYRAVHGLTGHPVMLYFLAGALVQDPRAWTMAAMEVQAASGLVHPHVQRYFEVVDLGAFRFVVTEDLRGITLDERLGAQRVAPMEACRIARNVALGLAALHAAGRPHGDVRPLNVWLDQSVPNAPEGVKLLREAWQPPVTPNFLSDDAQGLLAARCDYIAPEFQMPGRTHDVLTDIYSLGCTMYHLLTGEPPFAGGTITQKLTRHATEAIQPLEHFGIPQPLGQLVMYLMAKNPAVRYQDAQTVADQLAVFLDPQWLHVPVPAAYPTLPAYEQSLQQTHAQLAAQQQAAEMAAHQAAQAPPAPVSGTSATIPAGRAIEAAPVVSGRPIKPGTGVAKPITSSKEYVAMKEEREESKLITVLGTIGAALIAIILLVNYMGGGKKDNATETAGTDAGKQSPPDAPPPLEEIKTGEGNDPVPVKKPPEKSAGNVPQKTTAAEGKNGEGKTSSDGKSAATAAVVEIVPDDGALLWASPTKGQPVDLKYVPPLAGLFVVVRPADLLATSEGSRVLQSLGPTVNAKIQEWEKATGIRLADIEKLVFSLHDNDSQFPGFSVVAHLKEARTNDALLQAWGNPAEKKDGNQTYYAGPAGMAFYIPAAENGKVVVTASEYLFKDALDSPIALLKTELKQLQTHSDDQRHVNVLLNPSFIFSGSSDPLFEGELKRVREPLQWLLGEGLQAGSMGLHFGDAFFMEMRFVTKVDKDPFKLAEEFRGRLKDVPTQLENYFAEQLNPPVYWKKFAFRFPNMIGRMHEMTRVGVEDKQAVVNMVLPATAGHNLILGSELAMATAPGGVQVASTGGATGGYSGPATLEEAVGKVMVKSFSFSQQSLERAVELLEEELKAGTAGAPFEAKLHILGKDLQIEGITRNQSVRDFSQDNKSVADILTALVMKANPVTTVKSPTETDQKLIWVVAADPDTGKTSVLVTTRTAAEKRKNKLPAVFVAQKT